MINFIYLQTIPLASGTRSFNLGQSEVNNIGMERYQTHTVLSDHLFSHYTQHDPNHVGSIQVWPTQPLSVSASTWAKLSGAPCETAEPLIEQLNIYSPTLPPYIAMGEVKVGGIFGFDQMKLDLWKYSFMKFLILG